MYRPSRTVKFVVAPLLVLSAVVIGMLIADLDSARSVRPRPSPPPVTREAPPPSPTRASALRPAQEHPAATAPEAVQPLHLPHGLRPVEAEMQADVRRNGMPPSGMPQAVVDDGPLARCLRKPVSSQERPDQRMKRCAATLARK